MKVKSKKDGKIFVISAPSGTGKSTIVRKLMKKVPGIRRSISCTTRPPREFEIDKRDYFFLTPREFRKKIKSGFFVEWARVYGHYYGTSYSFINRTIAKGKHLILVIDTQGAFQIRRKYPGNSILVFILPPSLKELERRLKKRGTEPPRVLTARLKTAKEEIQKIKYYDYAVVNRKIEQVVEEIKKIVSGGEIGKNNN